MIIGICGLRGSGKDTLAGTLKRFGFVQFAFADGVYDEVARQHGITVEEVRRNKKVYTKDLQNVGDGTRVSGDPNHWLNELKRKVAESDHNDIVISDCRYPNEFEWVREVGVLVRVSVSQEEREYRLAARDGVYNPEYDLHVSEQHVRYAEVDLDLEGDMRDSGAAIAIFMAALEKGERYDH